MELMPIVIADGLTNNQAKVINAYVTSLCNVSRACSMVDISRQTFYRWVKESDSFKEAVETAEEGLKDRWEEEIQRHVFEDRNPMVLNKFGPMVLKDRGYGEAKDLNVLSNNTNDNNVVVTVIDATSVQEEQETE